jgi:hypothetical protein
MTRLVTANRRSKTNGEPRNRQVDTGNLERPAPELTDAYNAANEAISVTYGTREPRRLVTCWRSRTVAKVEVSLTEAQTRQFVTLYQALQGFDDRAAQARIRCPRLCFVGAADEIDYGERWGGIHVSFADAVVHRRAELEALGWQVRVLEGLDHTQAMQAVQCLADPAPPGSSTAWARSR